MEGGADCFSDLVSRSLLETAIPSVGELFVRDWLSSEVGELDFPFLKGSIDGSRVFAEGSWQGEGVVVSRDLGSAGDENLDTVCGDLVCSVLLTDMLFSEDGVTQSGDVVNCIPGGVSDFHVSPAKLGLIVEGDLEERDMESAVCEGAGPLWEPLQICYPRFEGELDSVKSEPSRWVLRMVNSFRHLVGVYCEGYEQKLMDLFKALKMESARVCRQSLCKSGGKMVRELKGLVSTINYEGQASTSKRNRKGGGHFLVD